VDPVDHQSAEIDGLLAPSTLTAPSSVALGWQGLAAERRADQRPAGPMHELYGTDDAVLRDLTLLLAREGQAGGASGRVYAESLSTALATRLLFLGRSLQQPKCVGPHPLPRRILRRVIDRMEAGLDADLTLAALPKAATAGPISRACSRRPPDRPRTAICWSYVSPERNRC
jgi:hypothetical protein